MFKRFKTAIFVAILDGLARLPFISLPFFGWILGWINYLLSPKTAKTMQENLRASHLFDDEKTFKKILHANIQANGMGLLETLHIWRKPYAQTLALVQQCSGWAAVEDAIKQQKGTTNI